MGNNFARQRKEPAPGLPRGDMIIPPRQPLVERMRFNPHPIQSTIIESRIPAITPTPNANSFQIWQDLFAQHKIGSNYDYFNTRLNDNADELLKKRDEEALQIQRERARMETEVVSQRLTTTPPLTLSSCLDMKERFKSFRQYDMKYFEPKKERPPLTPEMEMIIADASKPQPANDVIAEIDGVQILRRDIYTLTGLNWLNDEIINAYLNLIVKRGQQPNYKKVYAFNTFFYPKLRESGHSSIRRWTRKVDIFSFDYLLIPVHLGNHWCLAIIDFPDRTISYYDSLGGSPSGCCDTLLEYMREESMDKKKQDFDDENWRMLDKYSDGIPQQRNCSDCGVFACIYAEHLTRNAKLNFSQEHMPYYRKKMIYELITGKILE